MAFKAALAYVDFLLLAKQRRSKAGHVWNFLVVEEIFWVPPLVGDSNKLSLPQPENLHMGSLKLAIHLFAYFLVVQGRIFWILPSVLTNYVRYVPMESPGGKIQ